MPNQFMAEGKAVADMQGRADIHIHTRYSGLTDVLFLRLPDSVARPSDIITAAEARGLDVICVTDHNSIRGGQEAARLSRAVDVVVGAEISSADGEILGLYLSDDVPKELSAEETVDLIHGMGGLAIAPHPFSAHCSSLGLRIFDIPLDGIEVFNATHVDGYSNDAARRFAERMTVATVGGSDAHSSVMVGNGCTLFDGCSADELRRAILRRETRSAGAHTPLRQLVWFATEVAAEIHKVLLRSLLRRPPLDDTECERVVALMRRSSKLVSLVGTTAFMVPPKHEHVSTYIRQSSKIVILRPVFCWPSDPQSADERQRKYLQLRYPLAPCNLRPANGFMTI